MKIRADEHVSRRIVETVRKVSLGRDLDLDHVADAGQQGQADQHWITTFAANGGEAILTADHDFVRKPPQVAAVFRTGIKIMLLPRRWGQAIGSMQAAHILLWWPRIEERLRSMRGRECYQPEWNVSDTKGKFAKVEIDFQGALRRLRHEARSV